MTHTIPDLYWIGWILTVLGCFICASPWVRALSRPIRLGKIEEGTLDRKTGRIVPEIPLNVFADFLKRAIGEGDKILLEFDVRRLVNLKEESEFYNLVNTSAKKYEEWRNSIQNVLTTWLTDPDHFFTKLPTIGGDRPTRMLICLSNALQADLKYLKGLTPKPFDLKQNIDSTPLKSYFQEKA